MFRDDHAEAGFAGLGLQQFDAEGPADVIATQHRARSVLGGHW
jgi:hypothetical protein